MKEAPIDVVITWVDGDDPVHRRKRESYLSAKREDRFDTIAGETRFKSLGEIFYCVASIYRFAPFVHKIYIVTDDQDPHLDVFLARNFPGVHIPVEIVDHKVVFRGYEQYLPTFNSRSIETVLHRIPGLSEQFVFFNDDFCLLSPLKPEDWFEDGKPVLYGKWQSTLSARLEKWLSRRSRWRNTMLNAADTIGGKARSRFFRIYHTPRCLKKSVFDNFYAEHPGVMERNLRFRFRDMSQFQSQVLCQTLIAQTGACRIYKKRDVALYLKPDQFDKYMKRWEKYRGTAKFCCVNSLDQATPEQQATIRGWIEGKLQLKTNDYR